MERKVGLLIVCVLLSSVGVVANDGPRPRPLAADVWVDDGTRGCDGHVPCVQSVQDAIANWVDAGGTVHVLGSSVPYRENVNVIRPVNVVGENRANVTVDGQLGVVVFEVRAGPVLL